ELMAVNGMGPAKLQRYGVQILAEVSGHAAETPVRVPPHLSATAASVDGDADRGDGSLYDALRAWRRRRSMSEGVKLWEVCSNDVLLSVIADLPRSIGDLRVLDDVTPQQADRYGEEIVAVVSASLDATPAGAPDTRTDHAQRLEELR